MAMQTESKPYVPMTVEEISRITSLKHWSNRNVRVIGRVVFPSKLVSVYEQGGPYETQIDLHLLDVFPQQNTNIQVFGEVELTCDFNIPQIRAYFFRRLDCLNIESYNKAVELQKKYIPHFII